MLLKERLRLEVQGKYGLAGSTTEAVHEKRNRYVSLEPVWLRCNEDTGGLEVAGEAVQRNERRENAAYRRQRRLLVMKRERCSLGGDWGGGGEREELLGAYFIPCS